MTGAAGGLAGGLWAQFDAELVAGAPFVLSAVDYDARMRAARAVITGEGRLDRQSLVGKLVSEVATRARQAGVPCHAVVGSNALDLFDMRILDLQLVLEASTLAELEAAGAELGAAIAGRVGSRRIVGSASVRERLQRASLSLCGSGPSSDSSASVSSRMCWSS